MFYDRLGKTFSQSNLLYNKKDSVVNETESFLLIKD